jgi:hypothetical protein
MIPTTPPTSGGSSRSGVRRSSAFGSWLTGIAVKTASGLLVRGSLRAVKQMPTKSAVLSNVDDLRPEYDLSQLTGGVRGKYHEQATAGTTLVLLEADVAKAFPDGRAVNAALRALIKVARAQVPQTRSSNKLPNKPYMDSSRPRSKKTKRSKPRR